MRVLVVEDTADLGEGMVGCVGRMGHAVDWARDGAEADAILRDTPYELVVLDLSLPELDGVAVLRNLRARRQAVPVLVVTARSEIDERVTVLDQGADDYLVKPFDFREFEARVRSLLRRRDGERTNMLSYRALVLDRASRIVTIGGRAVGLTRRELLAETDPMLEQAISLVIAEGEASASLIQRKLGIGYPRAARIMDLLAELGVVGELKEGARGREVLLKPGKDPFGELLERRMKNS